MLCARSQSLYIRGCVFGATLFLGAFQLSFIVNHSCEVQSWSFLRRSTPQIVKCAPSPVTVSADPCLDE